MKTSELIEKMTAQGYLTAKVTFPSENTGLRITNKEHCILAVVSTDRTYGLDTRFQTFQDLSEDKQDRLYNILDKYARTPIEAREGEEKFIFRFPYRVRGREFDQDRYIIKDGAHLTLDPSPREHAMKSRVFHFTDRQVKELSRMSSKDAALFETCEKERVE